MKIRYNLAISLVFATVWILSSCSTVSDEMDKAHSGLDPATAAKTQTFAPPSQNQSELLDSEILEVDSRGDDSNALNFEVLIELSEPAKVYVFYVNYDVVLFRTITLT